MDSFLFFHLTTFQLPGLRTNSITSYSMIIIEKEIYLIQNQGSIREKKTHVYHSHDLTDKCVGEMRWNAAVVYV